MHTAHNAIDRPFIHLVTLLAGISKLYFIRIYLYKLPLGQKIWPKPHWFGPSSRLAHLVLFQISPTPSPAHCTPKMNLLGMWFYQPYDKFKIDPTKLNHQLINFKYYHLKYVLFVLVGWYGPQMNHMAWIWNGPTLTNHCIA